MEESVDKIIEKLKAIGGDGVKIPQTVSYIRERAKYFIGRGWSESDIVAYLSCTEEINPELDEDVALNRMRLITNKYKAYQR